MGAEQVHTAKTEKELNRPFGNWVFSVLKRVKILEIRENYSCKQFFGVSFEGTALPIHAGSEPTFHPSKDMEPRVCFGLCCQLQSGSTSAWPVSGLPKCLHWVLHRFNSHSRIFSAEWLERKCICRWRFCTCPLWGTMSGKKRREGEPMTGFWTWNVGIKIIYNRIYGRIWDLHPEATITQLQKIIISFCLSRRLALGFLLWFPGTFTPRKKTGPGLALLQLSIEQQLT